ncbi:MAG: type II toxin-antitoxin system RelE/ParE family toxin [Proteobacteria bacterium]|nr:type II toxin-antitoxin system RelE/ParE family toxin [Pseudomonadota bacterium]
MEKLWEVRVDPEVDEFMLGRSAQDNKKFDDAFCELKKYGPHLERETKGKFAHSLKNAKYANLKQLIVKSGRSVLRFAYYVDKKQVVHILCGGDKRGVSETVFYRRLIARAIGKIEALNKRG